MYESKSIAEKVDIVKSRVQLVFFRATRTNVKVKGRLNNSVMQGNESGR